MRTSIFLRHWSPPYIPEVVDVVKVGEEASNKETETWRLVSQGFGDDSDSRKFCRG
ncbi:hypothetical protein K443DRAFT_673656 [Laccaria amethystina LaAM-08-1]|uniref:Unplaced genomic scaffold K443scaffold_14, whole genome shotgun sequence n=1 Tax=Laccaria amethystina LaAM-08-1 TaxID=1095629 RepID=A0A0C9X4J4_9AGAR|nr:hypothetical protein K443DRAFT_673656 [Laccaria amethystina LaAM-08-1]